MNKSSIIEAYKELNFKLTDDNTIYNLSNKIICNFIPNVKYQKIIDNKIYLCIDGTGIKGEKLPEILLDSYIINKPNWVIDRFGFKYFIDKKCIDDFMKLIQLLSIKVETKLIYNHTGWIKQNNKWGYLHGAGCIGNIDAEVYLDESINNYILPDKITDLDKACKQSLKLIDILSDNMGIIPLSVVYLAPVIDLVSTKIKPPEFVLWIWGKTGSRKTSLSKAFLSHFGDFTRKIPATFNDTVTSIELKGNLLKDTLYLCDDYAPKQEYKEEKIQDSKAELILRMYGDRVGKSRSSNKLDIKKNNEPRGMIFVTGEGIVSGESSNARLLSIEVCRNSVDLDILTDVQNNSHLLAESMRGYIEWILESIEDQDKFNEFISSIIEIFEDYKRQLNTKYRDIVHGRTIESCAWINLGYVLMLNYMYDKKIINDFDYYSEKFNLSIDQLVDSQNKLISSNSIKGQFLNTLKELIDSKSLRIATLNSANQVIETNLSNISGYKDDKYYYFYADKIYISVNKEYLKKGVNMGISQRALIKRLKEEGIIKVDSDNSLPKKVINERDVTSETGYKSIRPRMLQFDIDFIDNLNV